MFLIKRTKGGASHFVTKIDPKGFAASFAAEKQDATPFEEAKVDAFAKYYGDPKRGPNVGEFEIIESRSGKVVGTIPRRPASAKQDSDGKTGPVVTIPESKGVEIATGKADTKGHPTAKDLAGSDKK